MNGRQNEYWTSYCWNLISKPSGVDLCLSSGELQMCFFSTCFYSTDQPAMFCWFSECSCQACTHTRCGCLEPNRSVIVSPPFFPAGLHSLHFTFRPYIYAAFTCGIMGFLNKKLKLASRVVLTTGRSFWYLSFHVRRAINFKYGGRDNDFCCQWYSLLVFFLNHITLSCR